MLVVLVLGALVGGAAWWWWFTSGYVSTDDARIKADVVAISAELRAKITSLTKREGDKVFRNEVLATLDRRELEIQIKQAQAELDRLRSKAQQEAHSIELYQATQREEVAKAEAALRAVRYSSEDVRAHVVQAKQDWNRSRQLFQKQLVPEQDLNRAATELRQSEAQLSALQEKIKEGESQLGLARLKSGEITVMQAELRARRAEARRAEAELADLRRKLQLTTIHSPVTGVVVKKSANPGEVIQIGQPIYMIVDSSRFWVEANVEETEIRFVKPGDPVFIQVDSYPDRQFTGKVIEIGGATVSEFSLFNPQKLTGQFIKSTQRLPVKISVANDDGLLKVGMLVVVRITKSAQWGRQ